MGPEPMLLNERPTLYKGTICRWFPFKHKSIIARLRNKSDFTSVVSIEVRLTNVNCLFLQLNLSRTSLQASPYRICWSCQTRTDVEAALFAALRCGIACIVTRSLTRNIWSSYCQDIGTNVHAQRSLKLDLSFAATTSLLHTRLAWNWPHGRRTPSIVYSLLM